MNISEYVVEKLDEAIEKQWIQVYYQPVVRSLTGGLCGTEALARWVDPEEGILRPDLFIGTLEEAGLIHKLDCYVIERVCSDIHERLFSGRSVVPSSVNLSRLDFIMCDMLKVVEEAVKRYDIPRDYIHIEITESMIVYDEELMSKVTEDFRETGYEVWMDDFGSGYSSLTLLKDYNFDLLKMDMNFLSSFNDRTKSLVKSVVMMAKELLIRTLAEGVETKEELEFLRSIGCGKIQGYYYGKPEPIEDMYAHLKEKGIPVESRNQNHYYEAACQQIRPTDVPLEIIEDDGKTFKTLYMNKAYKEQIFKDEPDIAEADRRIYGTASPLIKKYREFADVLEHSRKEETFYYTVNGDYMKLTAKVLAEHNGRYVIKCSIANISMADHALERQRLDSKLRELNQLFDVIHLFDLDDDRIFPLLGRYKYLDSMATEDKGLRERMEYFINERIFSADRKKYRDFIDYDTLKERIKKGKKGYIYDIFGVQQDDGSYIPEEISIMSISGTGGNEFLFCMKPYYSAEFNPFVLNNNPDVREEYAMIWDSLIWNSPVKLYWKDKRHRYKGASQAFLDFLGKASLKELKGKTDEMLKWRIDPEGLEAESIDVIKKGQPVFRHPCRAFIDGVYRNIVLYEFPIFDRGNINGLVGFFVEAADREKTIEEVSPKLNLMDPVTGLMNAHGMVDAIVDHSKAYNERGEDFVILILSNPNHSRIQDHYGKRFADKLLYDMAKNIARLVKEAGLERVAISRPRSAFFSLIYFTSDPEGVKKLAEKIVRSLDHITRVQGHSVTVRVHYAMTMRSEPGVTPENLYMKSFEKLQKQTSSEESSQK